MIFLIPSHFLRPQDEKKKFYISVKGAKQKQKNKK